MFYPFLVTCKVECPSMKFNTRHMDEHLMDAFISTIITSTPIRIRTGYSQAKLN